MIIGFSGASGRTDASHCSLLFVRALHAVGERATLLVAGMGASTVIDASRGVIEVREGADGPEAALRTAVAARASEGGTIVADLPGRWLDLAGIRSALDAAIVVVGPHEADERVAAAAMVGYPGPGPWHLGCRRGGGASAAVRFAADMATLAPGMRTLPLVLAPLGRGEAAGLGRSAPSGRTLRSGLSLLTAIRQATEVPSATGPGPLGADASEHGRIVPTADPGSLPDRLRDLADDVEAAEAGLAPDPARLADAPILDAWALDAIPVPVLKGSVTGHPGIADGRRVRTTEVFLTDRATHARTLSRWYRLRAPAGAPAPGLQ